ncbi:MAG: hypothetical protein Q9174_003004 [Haloplaca sp. 1 TL-2023]
MCTVYDLGSRKPGEDGMSPIQTTVAQRVALDKIINSDYKVQDVSAKRRTYEINMLLLFRFVKFKQFHQTSMDPLDEPTLASYNRLLAFINNLPDRESRVQQYHRIYMRDRKNHHRRDQTPRYLTELWEYWKSLKDNGEEMRRYKDAWEFVAERPLAWEGMEVKNPSWFRREEQMYLRRRNNPSPRGQTFGGALARIKSWPEKLSRRFSPYRRLRDCTDEDNEREAETFRRCRLDAETRDATVRALLAAREQGWAGPFI